MAPQSDGARSAAFPATDDSASANDRDVLRAVFLPLGGRGSLPHRFVRPLEPVMAGGAGGVLGADSSWFDVGAVGPDGAAPAGDFARHSAHRQSRAVRVRHRGRIPPERRCARGHAPPPVGRSDGAVSRLRSVRALVADRALLLRRVPQAERGLVRSIRELRRRLLRARAGGVSVSSGVSRAGGTQHSCVARLRDRDPVAPRVPIDATSRHPGWTCCSTGSSPRIH